MNKRSQLLCADSALLFAALLGVGIFVIAGWLPPTSPMISAEALQQLFVSDTLAIRIGLVVTGVGCAFMWPFCSGYLRANASY